MKAVQYLFAVGACIAVQTAVAQTWTQASAPVTNCLSIACSADGSKVIAGGVGGIWISSDSGNTWSQTPTYTWDPPSLAVSADGTHLAVFANLANSLGTGPIFISTNAGLTWTTNNVSTGSPSWVATFFSADGSQLTALTDRARFTTTNGGMTWLSNSLPLSEISAAVSSADGSILVASGSTILVPNLCISTNAGGNWTTTNSLGRPAKAISASADGTRLVAGTASGIYLSTNSGLAWTATGGAPATNWISVASSADGARLVAASLSAPILGRTYPGPIYSSTNCGLTWISNNAPPQLWSAVASSADGSKWFAVVSNGGIWTCQTPPAPVLNITATNNARLCWVVPSTNLVLQQSPDLSATNWSDVTNAPVLDLSCLQYEVTLPPANDRGFFRLTTP
jgi:hypothetical protein